MTEITSRKNKAVLDAYALHDKKARDASGLFFTEGSKLLGEALSVGLVPERAFVTQRCIERTTDILSIGTELIKVSEDVYEKLSDENAPEGIFAIFKKPEPKRGGKSSVLLLEGIQDPGNLGTLIRCAVAFGVSEVLTVSCADLYNPKTVRSTMGAIFKMPCTAFCDIGKAVEYARTVSDAVIAAALQDESVSIEEADTAYATLMIGNEGRGLSEDALALSDIKAIIPIENIESLNASVAGAICMYDSMMKRRERSK